MSLLLIAIGNRFRGDDGVAAHALDLIGRRDGVRIIESVQPVPEMAADIAEAGAVIFLDADPAAATVRLGPLEDETPRRAPFGHAMEPATIVAMARTLYGYRGPASLCRIPAVDFGDAPGLSPLALQGVMEAATLLAAWLDEAAK